MPLTTHNQSEGRKALIIAAVIGFGALLALYVAQSDYDGSRARVAAEFSRTVTNEHKSVCERLGQKEATAEHQTCMGELMRLKQRHEELVASQNQSAL